MYSKMMPHEWINSYMSIKTKEEEIGASHWSKDRPEVVIVYIKLQYGSPLT